MQILFSTAMSQTVSDGVFSLSKHCCQTQGQAWSLNMDSTRHVSLSGEALLAGKEHADQVKAVCPKQTKTSTATACSALASAQKRLQHAPCRMLTTSDAPCLNQTLYDAATMMHTCSHWLTLICRQGQHWGCCSSWLTSRFGSNERSDLKRASTEDVGGESASSTLLTRLCPCLLSPCMLLGRLPLACLHAWQVTDQMMSEISEQVRPAWA